MGKHYGLSRLMCLLGTSQLLDILESAWGPTFRRHLQRSVPQGEISEDEMEAMEVGP